MAHNDRNYISSDFAAKLERARKRTQRTPQQHRQVPPPPAPPQVTSVFRVNNREPEPVPQFGVMEVEGLDDILGFEGAREAYAVVQASTSGSLYMVNAGDEIPYTHFGGGVFATEPTKILIDPTASPSFGDRYGASAGHWYVTPDIRGTLMYLGQNDGETGIFLDMERAIDSLLIGVTIASTADTFATITSRPPGWPEVPGEAASVVQITNPSSVAIPNSSFNCHAVYSRRNDTDSWELIGGGGSGTAQVAYGAISILGSTSITTNTTYSKVPLKNNDVTPSGITTSTDNFNLTIQTAGVYRLEFHIRSIIVGSLASTGPLATFHTFKNSSFGPLDGQVYVEKIDNDFYLNEISAGSLFHFRSSDTIDLRCAVSTDIFISRANLSLELVHATTST